MSRWWAFISLAVVAVTSIVLVQLCRKTDLVRDPPICVFESGPPRPYNLGRTQMAFWFFLILTSYVVPWLITHSLETITSSILALMGISAGTALGDTLIDANNQQSEAAQRRSLLAEKTNINMNLADFAAAKAPTSTGSSSSPPSTAQTLNDPTALQKRLLEIDMTLSSLEPSENEKVSQGFLRDLLTDGRGYSFHRSQIVAWTLVLGIIFVNSVYNSLQMPEFSSTLLGLMGISAGTYVSLKFPEK
jgi:hypothetical protein